jgi:hypothetical protein
MLLLLGWGKIMHFLTNELVQESILPKFCNQLLKVLYYYTALVAYLSKYGKCTFLVKTRRIFKNVNWQNKDSPFLQWAYFSTFLT